MKASSDTRLGRGLDTGSVVGACGIALVECDYDIDDTWRARAPETPSTCSRMAETVRPASYAGAQWGYPSEGGTPAGGVHDHDLSSTRLATSLDF